MTGCQVHGEVEGRTAKQASELTLEIESHSPALLGPLCLVMTVR